MSTLSYNYIPEINLLGPSASRALKLKGHTNNLNIKILENKIKNTDIIIFGKTKVEGERRIGVLLNKNDNIQKARKITKQLLDNVIVK